MSTAAKKTKTRRLSAPAVPDVELAAIERAITHDKKNRNSYHSLPPYVRKRRGCTDEDVEPADGTILHPLWRRGKLERRELLAWKKFWGELERSSGDSGPLCVSYTERVSTSSAGAPRADSPMEEDFNAMGLAGMRLANWNKEWESIEQKWQYLRPTERAIIGELIKDHAKVVRGVKIHSHDITYIGMFFSGYNDNRQSISSGVTRIQVVLSALADMYMLHN